MIHTQRNMTRSMPACTTAVLLALACALAARADEAPAATAAFVLATDYAAADGVTDAADGQLLLRRPTVPQSDTLD